ncbi:patatin-like phospholipase family protein [Solimonas sp. K1W22B-7]|uniref:patatin-like phospholipase family protein n=1 Tax=Solimonas sp. K1W22B-7 TaxID=2303331 RepID=UPI000E333352|nr:patatin-like phospholipase family protein [Solimonas sp. K1W22B-7]AXQ30156.1 patatin-like phospholipase family protein [Solimonas sp. K1W22B-7]
MSRKKDRPRRALVIGCGGVLGGAWSIATLATLQRELDWDPREAEILIGTSSGAVLSALLGAGVPVERMVASQRGEAPDCVWNHDRDTGGVLPPLPAAQWPGLPLARLGLQRRISAFTAATGLLPRGSADMAPFRRLIGSVVPQGQWAPHENTWIVGVDVDSGERVAFGREDAPEIPLDLAVCASYGVPGWCPPVEWQGRRYLDGGIASPTSADLLLGSGVTEALVLAPMASSEPDRPLSPLAKVERRVRRHMTSILDRELAQLEAAGIRTIRLEPGPEDLAAIGYNMMDHRRRRHVFDVAQRSSERALRAALQ